MKRNTAGCGVATAFVLAGALGVLAHGNATGIVAERMHGMMLMAQSMKSLSTMFDTASLDPATVNEAAATIEKHAGETLIALFPEGSTEAPSEAMPEIWNNWSEFSRLAVKLRGLAADLAKSAAADGNDAVESKPQQAVAASVSLEPTNMWAVLDEYFLLGLNSESRAREASSQQVVSAQTVQPTTVTARDVFVRITQTCASCHEKFRRPK